MSKLIYLRCSICKNEEFEIIKEGKQGAVTKCSKCKQIATISINIKKQKKQPKIIYSGDIKYIINDRNIVAIRHDEEGNYIKAIAKCHPEDEFDEMLGMMIAEKRLQIKKIQEKIEQLINNK
jgi:hypothetical protein